MAPFMEECVLSVSFFCDHWSPRFLLGKIQKKILLSSGEGMAFIVMGAVRVDELVLAGRWDGAGGQHGQKETSKVKGRAGEMGW